MFTNKDIDRAMEIKLSDALPEMPKFIEGIRRAPDRGFRLSHNQTVVALKNALRYVPEELHEKLAPEFLHEMITRGRVYGYRYRPLETSKQNLFTNIMEDVWRAKLSRS